MQQKLFEILNLMPSANREEVDSAYRKLRDKLRQDMFLEGQLGNDAARRLTELENIYSDYLKEIQYNAVKREDSREDFSDEPEVFKKIEGFIKEGKLNDAQSLLDDIMTRDASWHYHQAMVYYKKDWFTDSKKHLEKAVELDSGNEKYNAALARLNKMMMGGDDAQKTNGEWYKTGENEHNPENGNWDENNRQMGGCNESMNCCTQLLCMNLLCNCCGGSC